MSQSTRPRRFAPGVARLLLALLFAFAAMVAVSAGTLPVASAMEKDKTSYEVDFMKMMSDHHFLAAQMSEICLKKATHDELRDRCQSIITSQKSEIRMMQGWLSQWYGVQHDPQLPAGGQAMLNRLNTLSGKAFEREFMKMIISHHALAINMATTCLQDARHSELLNLCKKIITDQAQEIREMRGWLCDWYATCAQNKTQEE